MAAQSSGTTTRVSVASDGGQADDASYDVSVSGDGRYVAFESWATNLVPGDTNDRADVFVHDLVTRQTTRVSLASDGTEGNHWSSNPSISADGRYVAFYSYASNLVSGDTNGKADIFVRDRETHQTTRVSVDSHGLQANDNSWNVSISADGRYVAFLSYASNLVPGDTNSCSIYTGGRCPDVFVHDRGTQQTTRVSVASDGTQSNNESGQPSIAADGRYVAFYSSGSNLVPGDSNGRGDVFVHDRQTGGTVRVSVASDGTEGNGWSLWPAISAGGRYVAFESGASNLVAGDTNGSYDIFVHDRQTGETTRVSVASDGTQGNDDSGNDGELTHSISADGRYVAFQSRASNLVDGDNNGREDVFIHDRQTSRTTLVSVAMGGGVGNDRSILSSISADGRHVAFTSVASDLVPGDTCCYDAFVRDRGPQDGNTISGQVTFSDTHEPVAGVLISAGPGITTTTDVSGTYTLAGLAAGTYTVTATLAEAILDPAVAMVSVPSGSPMTTMAVPASLYVDIGRVDFVAHAPDFCVLGLEITQAVQDLDNSVPLVAGKRTYVRFHVRNAGLPYAQSVPARLTVTGSGGRVLSRLLEPITVRRTPDRGTLADSYYHELPPALCSGTITVTARVNPVVAGGRVIESTYTNNVITATRPFTDVPPLRLKIIDVRYGEDGRFRADPADVEMVKSWLARAYPIPSPLQVATGTLTLGASVQCLAYREGDTWVTSNTGVSGGIVLALAADGQGDLVAGGAFLDDSTALRPSYVAERDGASGAWSSLDGGTNAHVRALVYDGSHIYAGGDFTSAGDTPANYIARWDGSNWQALGPGVNGPVMALAIAGDYLYVGGRFSQAGGTPASNLARWNLDQGGWEAVGQGVNGPVHALVSDGVHVYIGGGFDRTGQQSAEHVASSTVASNTIAPLGGGGTNGDVYALAIGGGYLYAGGRFTIAGGSAASRVARYSLLGQTWSAMAGGVDNAVYALAYHGAVYVGGAFTQAGPLPAERAARWQPATGTWQSLSISDRADAEVLALVVDGGGRLWAGGWLWMGANDPRPDSFALLRRISAERERDLARGAGDRRTIYYGIVGDGDRQRGSTMIGGMGWPFGWPTPEAWRYAAVGAAGDPRLYPDMVEIFSDKDGSYADTMAGHEIGHTLGLWHVTGPQPPACDCPWYGRLNPSSGCCGCEPFPYVKLSEQYPEGSISPSSAPWQSTTIYGFDLSPDRALRPDPQEPRQFTPALQGPAVYTPTVSTDHLTGGWKDVMTYCPNKWISKITYEAILEAIQARMGPRGQQQALASMPGGVEEGQSLASYTSGDYLFVTGYIDTIAARATLDALYVETDVTPPGEPEPGDYSIALFDADDQVLAEYNFTPVQLIGADAHLRVISEWIPWNPGTARMAVISGTRELAMVPVSPNAPTITLLQPNGGETLAGATALVEWEAEDADGGNLEYLVQYSADDGETWRVVGLQIANTTAYTVELASLPGTTQGRFRVTVSDGINTAWDMSDAPFTVENKRPRPQIQSPGSGKRILPHETLMLRGVAYDVEDGTLAGEALAWHSDIDGDLGQGLVVSVSPWSAGEHTITLTATDGDGLTGTVAITLTVLADADGDGMPDDWEIAHGLDPQRDDSREDLDGDGLRNYDEYLLGTLPNNADTDGDGFDDALEILMDADAKVPGQGSQVTLRFSGEIRYAAGHWRSYSKPAMAMLPGPYLWNFDSYSLDLDIEGTDLEKTIAILKLVDSQGRGIAGGTAAYYHSGAWHPLPGSTNDRGALVCVLPGLHTSVTFRLTHAGASQVIAQNIAANSYVTFATQKVTVRLLDDEGYPLDTGTVQYYAGGSWRTFGDGSTFGGEATMELLPGTYTFRMEYAAGRSDKAQDIGADPLVTFQTRRVTVKLRDGDGEPLDTGTVQYYAGGSWRTFGEGSTSNGEVTMELLPGTYTFRMQYAAGRNDKAQDIGADPLVTFQTRRVTVELRDNDGEPLDTGMVQYYGSGRWRTFGEGSTSGGRVSMELLPNSYSFRLTYASAANQKTQNVDTDPTVVFQTQHVVVELKDSTGSPITDTATIQYYAGGWQTFGTGSTSGGQASMELLPKSYAFRLTHSYAAVEKSQDIGADPAVAFQTGRVHSSSGLCTHYYAGGWRTFTNDMELLPLAYSFRFSDGTPDTEYTVVAGAQTDIH
jgi:Tol biopolymer transport system component